MHSLSYPGTSRLSTNTPACSGDVDDPVPSPAELWSFFAPLIAGQPVFRTMNADQDYLKASERPLDDTLPARPAAVLIYSPAGLARTLCLDFDAGQVDSANFDHALSSARSLLTSTGLRFVEDVSPSSGRHIYVPLGDSLGATEARELVEALALRFPSLDPSPHRSARSGCVRTPGSRHKTNGWQKLVTPLSRALEIFATPNPADAITRLSAALHNEIEQLRAAKAPTPAQPRRAYPRHSSEESLALGPVARQIGVDGMSHQGRYSSPSEARMAVLCSLASSGWDRTDLQNGIEGGKLPGLAELYARYKHDSTIIRTLDSEWTKAVSFINPTPKPAVSPVRKNDMNAHLTSQGGGSLGGHGLVRESRMLLDLFDARIEKVRESIYLKFILRALLVFAQMTGSQEVAVGCRAIAVATGLHHATVARHLRRLVAIDGSPVRLVARGRGLDADRYVVELSAADKDVAMRRGLAKGKIHAVRPVFRALGPVAALVYEAIERRGRAQVSVIVQATGMSRSAVYASVREMAELGMLRADQHGWKLEYATDLVQLADQLGVLEDVERQINLYRHQRRLWATYLASIPGNDGYMDPLAEHELLDAEKELFDAAEALSGELFDSVMSAERFKPELEEYWMPPPESAYWGRTAAA